ncbi:glutathione S-transferase family protein [Hoeflea poritis]|uniref:Glutathione S-transferase n=1 Tax=Hoeflea poritis TaxID=2993659 RepID=A0ABT4VI95_9HYPH|nr:glutathione S-transferase family protein [Hoeflea poritis]MDA4843915.1 glutathione S-transferase [Hoeflea poritis]
MIMYGAEVSYFSGKLRAYLDWKGLEYKEIQASRDIYIHKILPNIGWLVIPVIERENGTYMQDTTEIIRSLEAEYPEPPVLPAGPVQAIASMILELYGDEWLVLPAMHYRWNHNREFAIAEFGALSAPGLDADAQRAVGERIAKPFAGALPALGVSNGTTEAIEESYMALLRELERHFSVHHYVLGRAPSLGDFGLFGPLYAHLYRDPASGALMREKAPAVAGWVERMRGATHRGQSMSGADAVPTTLLPVLRRAMDEHLPVLLDTVRQVAQFAKTTADRELPRAIGFHQFRLGEATGQRAVFPYAQWMLQHVVDKIQSVAADERSSVMKFLDEIGATELAKLRFTTRVRRKDFQLILDN